MKKVLLQLAVICSAMMLVLSTSHLKSRIGSGNSLLSTSQKTQLKEVQDCGDPVVILGTITDMITNTETKTDSTVSVTFQQKVSYMEQVIVEITHVSEYYELRNLQTIFENQQGKSTVDFWTVFIKTMQKQFEYRSNELTKHAFINSYIFAMRMQIYTSVRMVSMLHNFEYTLMSNNLMYEIFTVSKSFFLVTVDFFRLVQVDRLMGKGVLFQISEQISQVQMSVDLKDHNNYGDLALLNNLYMKYETRVVKATETYQLQLDQLNVLQKVQYQYDAYSRDTNHLLSRDGMRAIASHLSELNFKQAELFFNYAEVRSTNSPSKILQLEELKIAHANAVKQKTFSILKSSDTTDNFEAMDSFLSHMMSTTTQTMSVHAKAYLKQEEASKVALNCDLHKFNSAYLKANHGVNPYVTDYIGLDFVPVNDVMVSLDMIYDFLQAIQGKQIFQEQIRLVFDFQEPSRVVEQIYYSVQDALVGLKYGYENYIDFAYQYQQVQKQMGGQLKDILEARELEDLLEKRIKVQQQELNTKMKIHGIQLYEDFLSIMTEVRNYVQLQKEVTKAMTGDFDKLAPNEQNKMLLQYLQTYHQHDIQRFYDRFTYKLNTFFLTQVNIIASVKIMTQLLTDRLIKVYFSVEKQLVRVFKVPTKNQETKLELQQDPNSNNEVKRFKKMYLSKMSKRFSMEPIFKEESTQRFKSTSGTVTLSTNDYTVATFTNKDAVTIYYMKIQDSAMYKEQILFTKAKLFTEIMMKFMMKKYTPISQEQQRLLASPFEDFEMQFIDGLVTRASLFRVDGMLMGSASVEMELYGTRKALLVLMEQHKCYLIQIYKEFQTEFQEGYIRLIKIDLNYQEFIMRVRQAFYMQVSDIEVVAVDETVNYYNTINQLKFMGYDEFTLQEYSGKNALILKLWEYKKQISMQSKEQQFRVFYCQGCYGRIVESIQMFKYSDTSYYTMIESIQTRITQLTSQTTFRYSYEINIVTYQESTLTQTVFYMVKIYHYVQGYNLVSKKDVSTHLTQYWTEISKNTETTFHTQTTETTTQVQRIYININCVLDYYFMTQKSFSIFDQVVTKSEHIRELYEVQHVVTTVSVESTEFRTQKSLFEQYIKTDQIKIISTDYQSYVFKYDMASQEYFESTTIISEFDNYYSSNKFVEDKVLFRGFRYFIYTPRKLVYSNYMILAQIDLLIREYTVLYAQYSVSSLDSSVFIVDLMCQCIAFYNPECLLKEEKLLQMRNYAFPQESTMEISNDKFRKFNNRMFQNDDWKVGQTKSWGKLFSKITNLVLDVTQDKLALVGQKMYEKEIRTIADFNELNNDEAAIRMASEDNGINNMAVAIYEDKGDGKSNIDVTLYKVTDKQLRATVSDFSIYRDDIRHSIISNQMKIAFMFPYKMVPENILDNGVAFRGQSDKARIEKMQLEMNTIYASNNMYTVYVGRMEDVIANKEYMRVFVGPSTVEGKQCYGFQAELITQEQVHDYSDVIDPTYVVTEVFYYFEQERREQYVQDFLAINYNDPFYQTLYEMGFYPVTMMGGDSFSIHHFYDFTINFNDITETKCSGLEGEGTEWMYQKPTRAMKRIWVRPVRICSDIGKTSADLYCAPRKNQAEKGESAVATAQISFDSEYNLLKTGYNVKTYFTTDTVSNTIETIAHIKKITGKSGRDSSGQVSNQAKVGQSLEPTGDVGNDYAIAMQQYYSFTDSATDSTLSYYADRKIPTEYQGTVVSQLYNQINWAQSGKGGALQEPIYYYNSAGEQSTSSFRYVSNRHNQQCYMTQPDMKEEDYLKYMVKMHEYTKQKAITVYGDCGVRTIMYVNVAFKEMQIMLVKFNANECPNTGSKRLQKKKKIVQSKKRRHKKRKTHKKKHNE